MLLCCRRNGDGTVLRGVFLPCLQTQRARSQLPTGGMHAHHAARRSMHEMSSHASYYFVCQQILTSRSRRCQQLVHHNISIFEHAGAFSPISMIERFLSTRHLNDACSCMPRTTLRHRHCTRTVPPLILLPLNTILYSALGGNIAVGCSCHQFS